MITKLTAERTATVFIVLVALVLGEVMLFAYAPKVLPARVSPVVVGLGALAILALASKLITWERQRRLAEQVNMERFLAAARAAGVEFEPLPEPRLRELFYGFKAPEGAGR